MFNLAGEVIGINTAIFSPSGGSIGIGFAIPSNSARPVIEQLIKHGQVKRGWLGVRIQAVTDEIAETLGLKAAQGALVASVIDGGPAQKANIRAGDIIVEFDGRPIDQMRQLPRVVAETEVGRTVDIKLWRENREMTVKVKVAALQEEEEKVAAAPTRGETAKASEKIAPLGVTVAEIDDRAREKYTLEKDAKGVVITDVEPGGPAGEAGIKPGEVIVEIGQERITSPAQFAAKVKDLKGAGGKPVLLLVEGDSGLRFVAVRPAKG